MNKNNNYININLKNKADKNESEKNKQILNKTGDNIIQVKNKKNSEMKKNDLPDRNRKIINNFRKDQIDLKKKRTKSSKKLTIKTIKKKRNADENADNKSTCTINNSKIKINVGRPSVNEIFYNSIKNTKSIQILSPIKPKQKKNLNKNKNSINLLGSYKIKNNNLLNFQNNVNNSNNLKKKNSTIFNNNKKKNISNKNKKNQNIINNNNIETNNTTGTIGTIINNKEDTNINKGLENKIIKDKSSKTLKTNVINSMMDSIESKNNDNSNYINNSKIIQNNKKTSNSKKTSNVNIHIENYDDNTKNESNENKEDNEPVIKNTDNYYKLLDISPDTSSSRYKKIHGMTKKNKSVSHIHIAKKEENNEINEEGLKKIPLSKKNFRPKLNDKIIIKFEELSEFETKLDNIINSLSNKNNINEGGASNECTEFMSFYYHSSLCGIFVNFFNPKNKIIIHSGNNLLLLSIIISFIIKL